MQIEKDNKIMELQTMLELQQRENQDREVEKMRTMAAIRDNNAERDVKYHELLTITDQTKAQNKAIEDKHGREMEFCKNSINTLVQQKLQLKILPVKKSTFGFD